MLFIKPSLILLTITTFGTMADVFGPVSDDFINHLNKREKRYGNIIKVVEEMGDTGSFGGKAFSEEKLTKTPIVFLHGNSDSALKFGDHPFQTGWNEVLKYFLSKDYTLAELYGITYGDRNISNSFRNFFNCKDLQTARRFIEFVLHYTKAHQVNIVAHSMGVSVARRAIKGGKFETKTETCHIGHDLSHRIHTFVALAGANYGMCPCQHGMAFEACGAEIGFWPGHCADVTCSTTDYAQAESCGTINYSSFLMDLNKDQKKDANFIASLWSVDDEILGAGNLAWGRHTSLVPHSDMRKVYTNMNHMDTKDTTAADQYNIIHLNEQKWVHSENIEYDE